MNNKFKSTPEEKELIDSLKKGDENALETVIDMYSKKVYNLAYNHIRNHQDVEDITQTVFIKVFQKIKGFKGKSSLATWIYRITVNCCKDFLKAKYRAKTYYLEDYNFDEKQSLENNIPSEQPLPSDHLQNKEFHQILDKALDCLTIEHREIIILRECQELTYNEISKILNISVGTVMSRLFNARKKLANVLKKEIG